MSLDLLRTPVDFMAEDTQAQAAARPPAHTR